MDFLTATAMVNQRTVGDIKSSLEMYTNDNSVYWGPRTTLLHINCHPESPQSIIISLTLSLYVILMMLTTLSIEQNVARRFAYIFSYTCSARLLCSSQEASR
jgi:hypothetical protein